jgi:hypothetical protein
MGTSRKRSTTLAAGVIVTAIVCIARSARVLRTVFGAIALSAVLAATASSAASVHATPCAGDVMSRQGLAYEEIRAVRVSCRTARLVVRAWVRTVADHAQDEEEYAARRTVLDGWTCRGSFRHGNPNIYLAVRCSSSRGRAVTFIGGS